MRILILILLCCISTLVLSSPERGMRDKIDRHCYLVRDKGVWYKFCFNVRIKNPIRVRPRAVPRNRELWRKLK